MSREEAQKASEQKYTGPTDLKRFDDLWTDIDKAGSAVRAVQSEEGLQAVLERENGKRANYTDGARNLDAALIRSDAGGVLSDLNNRFASFEKLYGDTRDSAANKITTAQGAADQASKDFSQLVNDSAPTSTDNTKKAGWNGQTWDEFSKANKIGQRTFGQDVALATGMPIGGVPWSPDDRYVFENMTEEEWKDLNSSGLDVRQTHPVVLAQKLEHLRQKYAPYKNAPIKVTKGGN